MSLVIGGVQPFSTVDYPGKLAAVIFTQGCSWRCPYCHNKSLQPFERTGRVRPWEDIVSFLGRRKGELDAVVFSGGEPTAQGDELPQAVSDVRSLGFSVGIHTNGMHGALLPIFDWVGLDIKAPPLKYGVATGTRASWVGPYESLLCLARPGSRTFEVRTTWDASFLALDDARTMAVNIAECGAPSWTIQRCTGDTTDLEAVAEAAKAAGTGMEIKVRG